MATLVKLQPVKNEFLRNNSSNQNTWNDSMSVVTCVCVCGANQCLCVFTLECECNVTVLCGFVTGPNNVGAN